MGDDEVSRRAPREGSRPGARQPSSRHARPPPDCAGLRPQDAEHGRPLGGAIARSSRRTPWARQCSRCPSTTRAPVRALILAAPFRSPLRCKSPGGVSASAHQGCILPTTGLAGDRAGAGGPPGAGAWAPTRAKAGGSQGGLAPLPIRGRGARRGTPTWGVPPKGALRGGPGGYPPWALWGTPQGGPSRGTPRDPRGTKKCTFRGVFNKSPIRDKHGTQFLDKIGTFWDKHGPPHTGPYGGTPPNPPFWDPPWDPPFRYIF